MFKQRFKIFLGFPKSIQFTFLAGLSIVTTLIFFAIFADFISPYDPTKLHDDFLAPPNGKFIMGTDKVGRDIFSRIIYGTKASLSVAFAAVMLSASIGVPVGLFSGYFGGKFDRAICIVMDALYAFPSIITALIIGFVLGPGAFNTGLAISVAAIPSYYRVVRSIELSVKELCFIEAERAIGANDIHIIFRHILPRCLSSILVLMTLGTTYAILMVSSLGFLGVGIPPPTPEWGTDLSLGRLAMGTGAWWPMVFPGMMIFISLLGFNMLGESLNTLLSPKERL